MSEENTESVTALVIGDPHFKKDEVSEGLEFIQRTSALAQELDPTFIVVLGDTLDKHNNAEVHPFKLAYSFLRELRKTAHVYFLVGNHDLRNNKEYFSDYHFFDPLNEFEDITLVDTEPLYVEIGDKTFVMVPYLPNGRFVEGLNRLLEAGEMWEYADCIFAHQEIRGCHYGAGPSITGDEWDKEYPPIISGHIHDSQIIDNVYYPGTPKQTSFGDKGKKRVWYIEFEEDEENNKPFRIHAKNLGMKEKRLLSYSLDEFGEEDISQVKKLAKKHFVKLKFTGTPEQFKIFRSRKLFKEFKTLGIKFAWNHSLSTVEDDEKKRIGREKASFIGVLQELVLREESPSLNLVYEKATNLKLPENESEEDLDENSIESEEEESEEEDSSE